ncbi:M28 family peptidase [Flavobacterium aciduliphilum]|uniref:Carboxypeptidase Q n=1 Tax=Flavobacterium aciduliphilum TaxID=1101402 RepID=A0A328Y7R9_9FLAO|nr:M28 family peptidase [Flavobacterium aciduliphilum]RAR70131.1 peptidase M28-like protein [Flavobacterium aciduliphilum]
MKKLLFLLMLIGISLYGQEKDSLMLQKIYTSALTQSQCYTWLDSLSNKIGARLSGSKGAALAVAYTQKEMKALGLDRVYLQEVMVPKWVRGPKETAYALVGQQKIEFPICALGLSVGTSKNGLTAPIIEVKSIEEMIALGDRIKGKIVFYNRPMNPEFIETFQAYGSCVDQRSSGAREAGILGALGVIVRSMNLRLDDLPHTGMTNYKDIPAAQRIPAAAISTRGAEQLSALIKAHQNLSFYFNQQCVYEGDVLSYNVIGEIKGSEHPENIMVVGGHLDSWDLGDGAQDDGAGCVQSIAVLELLKKLHYTPKNTLRVVLFMNEENGIKGALKYGEEAQLKKENHILAMESDSGGFSPRGFSIDASEAQYAKIVGWKSLFEPYLIHVFQKGHSGTDVEPIASENIVKVGLYPDSQRYFDYHHAGNDRFDAVNKRELELGAATMTALVYLFDKYSMP